MRKDIKENIKLWMVLLGIMVTPILLIWLKYYRWRAEHPYAELWTFFF